MEQVLQNIKSKAGFIIDMDGVIYHGNKLLPGVTDFLVWLEESGKKYLFLTNSNERTPKELQEKLKRLGINVGEDHFYTSALESEIDTLLVLSVITDRKGIDQFPYRPQYILNGIIDLVS
jgi:ribonucleotide monophosphatase NagD (HAD superfamily)